MSRSGRNFARTVVVLFGLHAAAVAAQPRPEISDEVMRAIERTALATLRFAKTVRPQIDRSAFDRDSLLDRLDFDETDIIAFTTNEVAYQPYEGVLRGAHGTLLARAGNALDQSLLLATLLRDAGLDAVIRGGTLSEADAKRLLSLLARRPEIPAPRNASVIEQATNQLQSDFNALSVAAAKNSRGARAFSMGEMPKVVQHTRDQLLATLAMAKVSLGSDDDAARLIAEARTYHWVDFRIGASAPWTAVHPAFGGAPPPTVAATETYADSVPVDLTHRLRVELMVEQRIGSRVASSSLMTPIELASANMSGRSISLTLAPDAMMRKDPYADGAVPEARTRFLVPLVNGKLPAGARVLALNGTTLPPDVMSVSATGIFETVGGKTEAAAAALQGLNDSPEDAPDLVAIESVRLRVTLIHPNATTRTVERFLYRASDNPTNRDADEQVRLVSEIARSHSLGIVTGALAPEYLLEESVAEIEDLAPQIQAWSDPDLDLCTTLGCLPQLEVDQRESHAGIAMAAGFFDSEMPHVPDSVIYRDAPNVIRLSRPIFAAHSPVPVVFDIMSNARRGFRFTGSGPVSAPELVLLAGVAESYLENLLPLPAASAIPDSGPRNAQTPLLLRAWIRSPPPLSAGTLEVDMMTQAITSGSVIVMATQDHDATYPGWWEVDPFTGRTLGMTRYGGSPAVEYILGITLGAVLLSAALCEIDSLDAVDRTRQQYTPTSIRHQRAGFLSCTVCLIPSYVSAMLAFDWSAGAGNVDSCIDSLGGWETEAVAPRRSSPPPFVR